MPKKAPSGGLRLPDNEEITTIEGNIFAAMEVPNAEEHSRKVDIALRINALIQERGWTKTEAAERTGFAISDVSNITRGRVRGFSEDRLLDLLAALGRDVTIVDSPAVGERGIRRFVTRDVAFSFPDEAAATADTSE